MNYLIFFSQSLNSCCYDNQFGDQIGEMGLPTFIRRTGVPKRNEIYSKADCMALTL